MVDETQPTSEWEHSHALEAGDELTDTWEDQPLTVKEVHDDGSITAWLWVDQRDGQEYVKETYTEEETAIALSDGIFEREDGKSHELASF